MKKHPQLAVTVAACLICIVATAVICLRVIRSDEDMAKYREIEAVIEEYYIGVIDPQVRSEYISAAQVAALDDRWSQYLSAKDYAAHQAFAANSYVGIGITVDLDETSRLPKVVALTPDSPAALAGLEVGNLLLSLGANALEEKEPADVRTLIESYGENSFYLTVQNAQGATRMVELRSRLVFSNPVSYEMLGGGIGYVKLRNFETGCSEGLRAAVDALSGANALIFDVRDNPGGKLTELIDALDCLLPAGDVFISRSRDGEETIYSSDAACVALPMAVLINGNSYSAAEFFAAVLQEYEVATIVGEPTTGKGRSQVAVELTDGSAILISNHLYTTPGGRDLAAVGGIVPDIEAAPREDDDFDVALHAAQVALARR